jgi:hypothetical protein
MLQRQEREERALVGGAIDPLLYSTLEIIVTLQMDLHVLREA